MLTVVIRKAGANGVAGEQQAKLSKGMRVNLPLYSPVTPVQGPAPGPHREQGRSAAGDAEQRCGGQRRKSDNFNLFLFVKF